MASCVAAFLSFLSTFFSAISILYLLFFIHDLPVLNLTSVNTKLKWKDVSLLQAHPVLNNIILVALFGLQHSLFARTSVRSFIVRCLFSSDVNNDVLYPSFYALGSSLVILMLCFFWIPITSTVWSVNWSWLWYAVQTLNLSSWLLTGISILSIHRFQLCGAEPLVQYLFGNIRALQKVVQEEKKLVTTGMYGVVRHPTMFFLILGIWTVPVMTIGQSLLSIGFTIYIVFAVKVYEEPQLLKEYKNSYEQYKKQVPCQLIPGIM